MSHLVPTHAASGAQRRDRAAFTFVFLIPRDHYPDLRKVFPFICTRTPARCHSENWRAKGRWRYGSGGGSTGSSPVPAGGTRKSLRPLDKCARSTGSSEILTREACACMRAPACVMEISFFTGTTGTLEKDEWIEGFTRSNYSSTGSADWNHWNRARSTASAIADLAGYPNKIWGGYAAWATVTASGADLRYFGGDAPRNFRARRAALAAADGAIAAVRSRSTGARENGGFPPFLEAGSARVGMAMLERGENIAPYQRATDRLRKPARFTRHVARDPQESPRGVDLRDRGVEPPSAARPISSMLALPIFGGSIHLLNRRAYGSRWGLTSTAKNGSGVFVLSLCSERSSAEARSTTADWVRDQAGSGSTGGQSRGRRLVWRGSGRVN